MESPRQSSLEVYHRRRHRATPGRGASLGARARSEAISLLLARKKCLKMQMKCFLPEPRLPLQPCTVATGSHAESLPRSLRLLVRGDKGWRGGFHVGQWAGTRA